MLGQNCCSTSKSQTSCRPFETLASSGESVFLSWYTEAQNRYFGDYIYQAKTGKEMLTKANEILDMKAPQRRAIALKAREYIVKHHNYALRAKQVLDVL